MLVDVVVVNNVKLFKSAKEWNIVVIVVVDNGRLVMFPIRGWMISWLWR